MNVVYLVLSIVAIAFAVVVPVFVEYSRRPVLTIKRSEDLNFDSTLPRRIVHVRVVNRPLSGLRGRWLLCNVATGCTVSITMTSRSDGTGLTFQGRWSGNPEPMTILTHGQGDIAVVYDPMKLPQTRVIDVSPGEEGQTMAIAIKAEGDSRAYCFASESYERLGDLRKPGWELPHKEYDVVVVAQAGGISSPPTRFLLRNSGSHYTDLELIETPSRAA
ncbi:MAG: hypothetical protein WBQ14_08270 [Gaiellaceae bacterium]